MSDNLVGLAREHAHNKTIERIPQDAAVKMLYCLVDALDAADARAKYWREQARDLSERVDDRMAREIARAKKAKAQRDRLMSHFGRVCPDIQCITGWHVNDCPHWLGTYPCSAECLAARAALEETDE